jgi:hypothetical protein
MFQWQTRQAIQNVQMRIKKASGIFVEPHPLRKNKNVLTKTNIRIPNKNVKSALVNGCETWEVIT